MQKISRLQMKMTIASWATLKRKTHVSWFNYKCRLRKSSSDQRCASKLLLSSLIVSEVSKMNELELCVVWQRVDTAISDALFVCILMIVRDIPSILLLLLLRRFYSTYTRLIQYTEMIVQWDVLFYCSADPAQTSVRRSYCRVARNWLIYSDSP